MFDCHAFLVKRSDKHACIQLSEFHIGSRRVARLMILKFAKAPKTFRSREPHTPKTRSMAASASILRTSQEQDRNRKRQDRKLAARFESPSGSRSAFVKFESTHDHLTRDDSSFTRSNGQVLGAHAVPKKTVPSAPSVKDVLSQVTEYERSASVMMERARTKQRMKAQLRMHSLTRA